MSPHFQRHQFSENYNESEESMDAHKAAKASQARADLRAAVEDIKFELAFGNGREGEPCTCASGPIEGPAEDHDLSCIYSFDLPEGFSAEVVVGAVVDSTDEQIEKLVAALNKMVEASKVLCSE